MEKITLNIKDTSKLTFLLEVLGQFEFVEIQKIEHTDKDQFHDFFASAGMWRGRDIDSNELRKQA